jgi:hypothetical protein
MFLKPPSKRSTYENIHAVNSRSTRRKAGWRKRMTRTFWSSLSKEPKFGGQIRLSINLNGESKD